jgi:hypothetical protein
MARLLRLVSSSLVAFAAVAAFVGSSLLTTQSSVAQTSVSCDCGSPNYDCPNNTVRCTGTVSYECSECTCTDITPSAPYRTWVCIH